MTTMKICQNILHGLYFRQRKSERNHIPKNILEVSKTNICDLRFKYEAQIWFTNTLIFFKKFYTHSSELQKSQKLACYPCQKPPPNAFAIMPSSNNNPLGIIRFTPITLTIIEDRCEKHSERNNRRGKFKEDHSEGIIRRGTFVCEPPHGNIHGATFLEEHSQGIILRGTFVWEASEGNIPSGTFEEEHSYRNIRTGTFAIQNERSKTNNVGRRPNSNARFLRLGMAKEFSSTLNSL